MTAQVTTPTKEKKFKREKKDDMIAVFLMEVVCILHEEQGVAYRYLHDLKDASFRMCNAAMRACILVPDGVHPASHAYREINRSLKEYREWNAIQAEKHPQDLHFQRRSIMDVPSSLRAYASNLVGRSYMDKRKKIQQGLISIPSYRRDGPIQVPKGEWEIKKDEKGYVLSAKLRGGHSPRMKFAVVPCGGSDHGRIKLLLSKEEGIEGCDLKLIYDERKRKWLAKIAFRQPRPSYQELDPQKKLAIHRGIKTFLTWACDGHSDIVVQELHDGGTLLRWKARRHRHAAALRKSAKHPGTSSRGHGVQRRFQAYRSMEDQHARFVKTLCQQLAAKSLQAAQKFGVGTIVIEDYSARDFADDMVKVNPYFSRIIRDFPFYQLRIYIEGAAERAGLKVEIVPAYFESCTCPKCGNVDAKQDDHRGNFTCFNVKCGIKRSVEFIAACNMLRMAKDPEGAKKCIAKTEEFEAFLASGAEVKEAPTSDIKVIPLRKKKKS